MISIQTRHITADEFREYTGVDLLEELKSDSNPSNTVNAFILREEVRFETFLNAHFFKNVNDLWTDFSDFQKLHYKYAMLEQLYYVYKNGEISSRAGLDPEHGETASNRTITIKTIAPNAKDHLRMTGLWSGHIGGDSFFGPYIV